MKECTWKERIESAARRDSFDVDELAHIQACSHCGDLAGMIRLLRAEGRSAERLAVERVPSAQAILAEARPLLARADLRKILWPIVWLERAAVALGCLLTIGAGWWLVGRARDSSAFDMLRSIGASDVSGTPADLASVLMLVAAVTVLTVAFYGLVGLAGTATQNK
ncbi:MAG: hypothetical protein V3T08_06410 [Gemmatimonadota bacterium]